MHSPAWSTRRSSPDRMGVGLLNELGEDIPLPDDVLVQLHGFQGPVFMEHIDGGSRE